MDASRESCSEVDTAYLVENVRAHELETSLGSWCGQGRVAVSGNDAGSANASSILAPLRCGQPIHVSPAAPVDGSGCEQPDPGDDTWLYFFILLLGALFDGMHRR